MPTADIQNVSTISSDPRYHGWPTIARTRAGELLVVYSGAREAHVCPFGQVHLIRSTDDGYTWSTHEVVADGPIDDRDAGILETAAGTLLVNWFTSVAYEKWYTLDDVRDRFGDSVHTRWQAHLEGVDAATRDAALGHWMARSEDGGKTWSKPYPSVANSPHGPTELSDGRLLYLGRRVAGDVEAGAGERHGKSIGAAESTDDGKTWRWIADIEPMPKHESQHYHELHAVECADGSIVAQIRNHNKTYEHETLQCRSTDGGRSWTRPRSIGVWGLPSHLMRLADDRLLMTYGHRRKPIGNRARVSDDHGQTWSEPIVLQDDAFSTDLGYPSTVQLDDGTLISVWYEVMFESSKAVLRMARWTLRD